MQPTAIDTELHLSDPALAHDLGVLRAVRLAGLRARRPIREPLRRQHGRQIESALRFLDRSPMASWGAL